MMVPWRICLTMTLDTERRMGTATTNVVVTGAVRQTMLPMPSTWPVFDAAVAFLAGTELPSVMTAGAVATSAGQLTIRSRVNISASSVPRVGDRTPIVSWFSISWPFPAVRVVTCPLDSIS